MEGVAINEITDAADVGFGSFYNHFESKEAIYAALVESVFGGFADALDRLLRHIADPAEVIAASVRHALRRVQHEPVWGKFLLREGLSARALDRGLGRRLFRDIKRGTATGRFTMADPLMCFLTVGGVVLGAISLELQLSGPAEARSEALKEVGCDPDDLPERAARIVLQALGLSPSESERISKQPLPTEAPPSSAASDRAQVPATSLSARPGARRKRSGSQRAAPG